MEAVSAVSGVDRTSTDDTLGRSAGPDLEGNVDVSFGKGWFLELFAECAAAAGVGDDRMKVDPDDVELSDSDTHLFAA